MSLGSWMRILAAQSICFLLRTSSAEDVAEVASGKRATAEQSLLQLGKALRLSSLEADTCSASGTCDGAQRDRHSMFAADHLLFQSSRGKDVLAHRNMIVQDHALLQVGRVADDALSIEHSQPPSPSLTEKKRRVVQPPPCNQEAVSRRRREGSCFCRRRHSGPTELSPGWACRSDQIVSESIETAPPTPPPVPTPVPTSECGIYVNRRRRQDAMCSCRRRSGGFDLQKGYMCRGDKIESCGQDCPIGWSPGDYVKMQGAWCEVSIPQKNFNLKTCPSIGPSTRVRVMTYNLFWWHLFWQEGGVHNGVERSAGKLIANTSGDEAYDVIGFQECNDRSRILGDAIAEGLPEEYQILDGGRGLAIVYRSSTWKLLDSGSEDVGEDSRAEYYGPRAAQYVRLEHRRNRKTLFFVNHHGPLPVSARGGCTGSPTAYNIVKLIASTARSGDAIVVLGDFNAHMYPDSRIDVLGRYLNRVFTGVAHGGVDHVFSNCPMPSSDDAKNLGSGGSDHDALSVVIKI